MERTPAAPVRGLPRTVLIALVACIAGCAALPGPTARIAPAAPPPHFALDADACHAEVVPSDRPGSDGIDPRSIELFNWNVRKGGHADWSDDLRALARDADLLTLQEAPLINDGWHGQSADDHHAFAPGFESRRTPTGVLTISEATPFVQCNLRAREPWLRTDKATVITEYALAGMAETLMVINIHAVNFTFGLGAFEAQMAAASDVIARHHGPVIFVGDFNTWRQARLDLLGALVESHGLESVDFGRDTRKRMFGKPLDHVYVRGLNVHEATTFEIDSSDHNPMRVWLSAI